jgi:hypothetical protein
MSRLKLSSRRAEACPGMIPCSRSITVETVSGPATSPKVPTATMRADGMARKA